MRRSWALLRAPVQRPAAGRSLRTIRSQPMLPMDLIAGLAWSRAVEFLLHALAPAIAEGVADGRRHGRHCLHSNWHPPSAFIPTTLRTMIPSWKPCSPASRIPSLNNTGYGVGLDQAAAYLDKKPGASGLTVMSANGLGSFSYYFPGTDRADERSGPVRSAGRSILERLRNTWSWTITIRDADITLADLAGHQAGEKSSGSNGIEFLRIYRSADVLRRVPAAQP